MKAHKITVPLSRDALIEQNAQLVPYAVGLLLRKMPPLSESIQSDAMSGGYLGLCEAADRFEAGRGAFSTYAVACIMGEARNALSKSDGDAKARKAGVFVGSLDAPIETGDGTTARGDLVADDRAAASFSELLDTADEADRAAQLWAWIRANVTPRQFNALRLCYADGKNNAQTAGALGKSHQAASARIQDGLAALKKASDTESGRQMERRLFGAE